MQEQKRRLPYGCPSAHDIGLFIWGIVGRYAIFAAE